MEVLLIIQSIQNSTCLRSALPHDSTCAVELMRRSTVAFRGAMASFSTSWGRRRPGGAKKKDGKTLGKPWENLGKTFENGKTLEKDGEKIRKHSKRCENVGKRLEKDWENQ